MKRRQMQETRQREIEAAVRRLIVLTLFSILVVLL